MAGEGAEEYLQAILEPALRNHAFNERNEIRLVSEDGAYSFLLGALTAGLMEGPGTARTELGRARVDSAIDRAYGAMGEHGLFSPEARAAVQRANRVVELPIFGSGAGKRASPLHITPDGVVMMPGAPGQNKTASKGEAGELNPISASMESSLSTGKNNIVAKTMSDIVSFVKTALAKRGGSERLYMGTIPESTASFIKSSTGMDVAGYTAILPGSSVQHIFNRHGDEKTEAARGQRAVSADDVAMIPQVLAAPDSVRLSDDVDNLGRPVLLFSKQIGDNIVTAQAVTDGRRALTTNSIWVQKKKNPLVTTSDANATIDPAHNAQSVPPSGSSFKITIPQMGSGVKGEDGAKGRSLPIVGGAWIDTFVPWPYNEEKGGTQYGRGEGTDFGGISGDVLWSDAGREGTSPGVLRSGAETDGGIPAESASQRRNAPFADWAKEHVVQNPSASVAHTRARVSEYGFSAAVIDDIAIKRINPQAWALTHKGTIYLSNSTPVELSDVIGYHEVVHAVKQSLDYDYLDFMSRTNGVIDFSSDRAVDVLEKVTESRFKGKDLLELSAIEFEIVMDELNAVVWGFYKANPRNAYAQFAEVFTDYDAYISELDAIMERVRRQRAGASSVPDRWDKAIEEGFADEKPLGVKREEDIDRSWEAAILASIARPISPSGASDPTAVPGGRPTVIRPKDDEATVRSITRENEAAQTIARSGYVIEQQPKVEGRKKPDYRIEGEVFDCYTPMRGTNPRNIRSNINYKVTKNQAKRIVLNLDDWTGIVEEVLKALQTEPVPGLEQVLVVKDGKVYSVFP